MYSFRKAVAFSTPLLLASAPSFSQQAAAPPTKPQSEMRRAMAWQRSDYTCDGGTKLAVYLHNQTVKVRFEDKNYLMKQVPSADGGRYSDGTVQWWGRGSDGFLQQDTADGNGAMIVKGCKLDKPPQAEASPEANTVAGTVRYLPRIALPPTAVLEVQLLDVSPAAGPAIEIAKESIALGDRQVPIPFSLKYDPAKIDSRHSYSVGARILVDGEVRFRSEASYPVLTQGKPNQAEIMVQQVSAGPRKP